MKYFIWSMAIFILLVLQVAVFKPLHLAPLNAVLVLMILVLIFEGFNAALFIAIAGGIMMDFLAGMNLGLMTFSLIVVLGLTQTMLELFITQSPHWPVVAGLVVATSLGWGVCLLGTNWLFGLFGRGVAVSPSGFLTYEFSLMIFNLVLTYPIFKYLSWTQFVYAKSVRNRN